MLCYVGKSSWLIFERLNLSVDLLDWMTEENVKWFEFKIYNEFYNLVNSLNCTNDEAERNVKLMQDYLKEGRTLEEALQDQFLIVSAHRKLVKADKAGNKNKTVLSKMGGIS